MSLVIALTIVIVAAMIVSEGALHVLHNLRHR
jgi:hypothetical protein